VCTDLGLHDEGRRAFDRAGQLLPTRNFAAVESAFVWLADGARPPLPATLDEAVSSPAPWERLLILAMAGEPPSASAVNALDREQAGYITPTTTLYEYRPGSAGAG
jgi:hypothetical protein